MPETPLSKGGPIVIEKKEEDLLVENSENDKIKETKESEEKKVEE
jgi:hypothetical protein